MPISVHITDGGSGFIMMGEGVITGQELINAVEHRFEDEERTKKYIYGMSDYTNVQSNEITSEDVRKVAEEDKRAARLNPGLVMAIVAPKDVMYGLSRMFQAYADQTGWTISVFRNSSEAESWIKNILREKLGQEPKIEFKE